MSRLNHPETLDEAIEIIDELYKFLTEDSFRILEAEELIETNRGVSSTLLESVETIQGTLGKVKKIASQTKLLAINAGIEAAQAGEAGLGFLVVAEEVKELSRQTSTSTTAILREIQEIETVAGEAAANLDTVRKKIAELKDSSRGLLGLLEGGR